ncbi:DUF1064 domain-containing protein [Salinicoccus sesuvii]|uniref:DUF1064 domain-containing protein n=1 Tax=Salinicoccus sesuvii TaxID=868281 RepID=A0ABV7N3G0_9STAP
MAVKDYYNTKKVEYKGIIFDSNEEAEYYQLLERKQAAGIIKEIELQPVLDLFPAYDYYGKKRQKMVYKLDFRILYSDGVEVYIDIKGMATETAKMKRKIAEYLHPDKQIIWIAKSKKWGDRFGWIEYDALIKVRAANKREANKKKRG